MALGPPWWSDISICKPLQFILDKKKERVKTTVLYLYLYLHSSWTNLYLYLHSSWTNRVKCVELVFVFQWYWGGWRFSVVVNILLTHVCPLMNFCLQLWQLMQLSRWWKSFIAIIFKPWFFSEKLKFFFFPWQFPFPIYICLLRRGLRYWFSGNIFFLQRL